MATAHDPLLRDRSREPLAFALRPGAGPRPVGELEFVSRGDRVHARLWKPAEATEKSPAILLTGEDAGPSDDFGAALADAWTRRGIAVCAVDLPLHGARADAKLRRWLEPSGPEGPAPELRRQFAAEFARQAVCDLARCLDALELCAGIDAGRVAFAGFGLGADVGARFCALDSRPRAVALVRAGLAPDAQSPETDPGLHVGRIAPRPLLCVGAEGAGTAARATEALYAAAAEPRELLRCPDTDGALPASTVEAIGAFLAAPLQT